MTQYLNLGCGSRFHPSWTNVDFISTGKNIIAHNLKQGIPFPDNSFEVVYHSHLLEHFTKTQALPFLCNCFQVLKPGGIIRIAVPDLENIAKTYLQALENAAQNKKGWNHHYEWIMLEMYDQTVRDRPGGDMADYLHQEGIPNKQFVLERIGIEGKKIIDETERYPLNSDKHSSKSHIMNRLLKTLKNPSILKELLIKRLLGNEYKLLQLGRFRRGGEIHFWMYDRYSLAQLLEKTGFQNIQLFGPAESQISGWINYNLDTEPDGTVYKPDSLYIEALKP